MLVSYGEEIRVSCLLLKFFCLCSFAIFFCLSAEVKRVGDLMLKIPTQCVENRNTCGERGYSPQMLANVLIKVNAKLGGTNCIIEQHEQYVYLFDESVNLRSKNHKT